MVTLLVWLHCVLAILWKIGNKFKKHISSCKNELHILISCKWEINYLRALMVLSTSFLKVIFFNGQLSAIIFDGSLNDNSFDEIPAGVAG